MPENITLRLFDLVGPLCVSVDDGKSVHDKIAEQLKKGNHVTISFAKVDTLISAFLNAAIGQLYNEYSEEDIRARLSVADLAAEDGTLIKRVVDNAKAYFKNKANYDRARKEELGDEE